MHLTWATGFTARGHVAFNKMQFVSLSLSLSLFSLSLSLCIGRIAEYDWFVRVCHDCGTMWRARGGAAGIVSNEERGVAKNLPASAATHPPYIRVSV